MIMNRKPYPISFEREMSQALVCRYGEEMRQYVFKPDIDVSGLSCLLQIAKTDGTFTENGVEVHTDPDTGECTLVITIPQQATVVKGLNRYSICVYGEIEGENHLLYSAEGPLWVDDDLITDEMIASVAEVNGLVFPRDFLTVENLVDIVNYVAAEILNDNTISTETTWSSQKISDEISGHSITMDLADLDDVEITSPTEGQALLYDDSDDKWKNGTLPDPSVVKEVTGNPIEITDAAAAPLVKCVTQITGYQEGTGTPSPDNIRPIVAYTEGEIEVSDGDGNTTTHTTTYPSAIYRGSEDVVNGEVECDWPCIDLGNLTWQKATTSPNITRFYTYDINSIVKLPFNQYTKANIICENLETETANNIISVGYDCCLAVGTTGTLIARIDAEASLTAEQFTTYVTGIKIAFELATPTTSSVTPTNLPIKTLSGYTHIESSTGEMEVEYITQTYEPILNVIPEEYPGHIYSTDEKEVGKWIDGRSVYEKTFEVSTTSPLGVNSYSLSHGISNLERVLNYHGSTYWPGSGGYMIPSLSPDGSTGFISMYLYNDTYLGLSLSDFMKNTGGAYYIVLTIQYIKEV